MACCYGNVRNVQNINIILKIWPTVAKPNVLGEILERFHAGGYKNGCYAFGYPWQPCSK